MVTRSRFVTTLAPASDRHAADEVIDAVRREFHDARHHCTAMVFGPQGGGERSNDDGEPPGTAGAPMLAVLRGAELTDIVAIVTRYFGGTLLGAGGLVRAYGGAVTAAVDAAERVRRRPVAVFRLRAAHEDAGRLEHRVRTWADAWIGPNAEVVGPGAYGAHGARFDVAVPLQLVGALRTELASSQISHDLEELGHEVRTHGGCEPRRVL